MGLGQAKLHRLNLWILVQQLEADGMSHRFQELMGRPFQDLLYVAVLVPI